MYKIAIFICTTSILLFGCSHRINNQQNNQAVNSLHLGIESQPTKTNNIENTLAIQSLSTNVYDTNDIFLNKIINEKSPLSDEDVRSIKGIIDAKMKNNLDEYQKLTQMNGINKEEIDVLKKGIDKLTTMESELTDYKDSLNSKRKLFTEWKIVLNYWKTYYEMSKND